MAAVEDNHKLEYVSVWEKCSFAKCFIVDDENVQFISPPQYIIYKKIHLYFAIRFKILSLSSVLLLCAWFDLLRIKGKLSTRFFATYFWLLLTTVNLLWNIMDRIAIIYFIDILYMYCKQLQGFADAFSPNPPLLEDLMTVEHWL